MNNYKSWVTPRIINAATVIEQKAALMREEIAAENTNFPVRTIDFLNDLEFACRYLKDQLKEAQAAEEKKSFSRMAEELADRAEAEGARSDAACEFEDEMDGTGVAREG